MKGQVHVIRENPGKDGRNIDEMIVVNGEGEFDSINIEVDLVSQLRQNMILELTNRLKESQKKTGCTKNCRQIALAAKQIEAQLFVGASSMEEYQDPSTLRSRFQRMVSSMLQRRLQKVRAEATSTSTRSASPAHRLKVLSASVNPDTARQVFFLVRQIENLQVGKPAEEKKTASSSSSSSSSSDGPPTCTTNNAPAFHLDGQQRLPKPVRELFFESSIVDAFYFTPLDRLKDLPWPRLVASAKKSVREYHAWIAQSK